MAVVAMTVVQQTRAELAAARVRLPSSAGLVPTMGALHDGHVALFRAARSDCAAVVVSIFINPLQFGPTEDLGRYPRSIEADLAVCEREGVDLVWVPPVEEVYRNGRAEITVNPGPLGDELEGAARPGHFTGVLTVVAKLLQLVRPDRAYFGEKDYQQLVLVRRMVADLDFSVDILGVPTVRDSAGLALSSRNAYLSDVDRQRALVLSRALRAGSDAPRDAVLDAAMTVLASEPDVAVDYLALRSEELGPPPDTGPARLLVAARVGGTRLIDNAAVQL
jgi:pantoate--beta-alanine ligase